MGSIDGAAQQHRGSPAFEAYDGAVTRKIICVNDGRDLYSHVEVVSNADWETVMVSSVEGVPRALGEHADVRVALTPVNAQNHDVVEQFISTHSHLEWIAISDVSDLEDPSVRRLLANLFYDYHTLPIDTSRLLVTLGHAHGMATLRDVGPDLNPKPANNEIHYHHMIGASEEMRIIYSTIDKVAPSEFPVLITGDSGTGKELVARAIHHRSKRSDKPLVVVNCGAVVPTLIQSELFGHEKGSFTNADSRRDGFLANAHGGTIFLDEVGELPLETQASLLRVLEENAFRRVGGSQSISSDVRVIAATNRDLSQTIAKGQFREDLFYRLSVVNVHLPTLAERRNDIEPLAKYYLNRLGPDVNTRAKRFSKKSIEAMLAHNWPGNVRELINRIKRAALLCENRVIRPEDLRLQSPEMSQRTEPSVMTLKQVKDEAERSVLVQTMNRANFNVTLAARTLGVSRVTLYNLLDKHELRLRRRTVHDN